MCEQDAERFRGRVVRSHLDLPLLRVVEPPVLRIVNADEGERRAAALHDVGGVAHQHLPRLPHPVHDLVHPGVVVVIPQAGHDAERRLEIAEGGDVVRNIGRVDVDHVAGLEDQIRTQRIRLRHERLHLVAPHVDPGVDVGEVQDAQAVEAGREVGEPQRAPGDVGEAVRAPDTVGRECGAGAGVGIGGAGEELPPGKRCGVRGAGLIALLADVGVRTGSDRVPRTAHFLHPPPDHPPDHVQRHQPEQPPPHDLPRDPRPEIRDPARPPHAAEQHATRDEDPREVEHREHGGERPPHQARAPRIGRVRQALAQVQVQQYLGRDEQEQID